MLFLELRAIHELTKHYSQIDFPAGGRQVKGGHRPRKEERMMKTWKIKNILSPVLFKTRLECET